MLDWMHSMASESPVSNNHGNPIGNDLEGEIAHTLDWIRAESAVNAKSLLLVQVNGHAVLLNTQRVSSLPWWAFLCVQRIDSLPWQIR